MNQPKERYIGVFDSGVGGISVLKELIQYMPHENYYYISDAAHAPYGTKDSSWILDRSRVLVNQMIEKGSKAVVIACNTATSAAASALRREYSDLPIIGVEPALKPAVKRFKKVMVMATPVTLRLEKYQDLAARWSSDATVINIPCPGLADRIEKGNLGGQDLYQLVSDLIKDQARGVEAVVLGCTHYIFIKHVIKSILGDVVFFDGGEGTAREVRRQLKKIDKLVLHKTQGSVTFDSSLHEEDHFLLLQEFFDLSEKI